MAMINDKLCHTHVPEDPAFSTGSRLIFKFRYLFILVSNNLVLDRIWYGIKLTFLNMFWFMPQVDSIQSYLNWSTPGTKRGGVFRYVSSSLFLFIFILTSHLISQSSMVSLIFSDDKIFPFIEKQSSFCYLPHHHTWKTSSSS
jgi:hypothetical protein